MDKQIKEEQEKFAMLLSTSEERTKKETAVCDYLRKELEVKHDREVISRS